MPDTDPQLLVFDVQRFCVHDGPGIRTVVFLKGCPLRCRWCQNPESLRAEPETAFHPDRCAGCMACADACPNGAIRTGHERIDRDRCQACGACADACPNEALRLIGRRRDVAGLVAEIEADRAYFEATGGGVTLSGGEPLLQRDGAVALLAACRAAGLHTAVETSAAVPWSALGAAVPHTDLFLVDLKAGDDALYREQVGAPLARVADHARALVDAGADVALRMPLVPGCNDGEDSIAGVAARLADLGRDAIRLLPYHRGGEDKIGRIGSAQPRLGIDRATADRALQRAVTRFAALGVTATVEGAGDASDEPPAERRMPDRVWRLREAVQGARPGVCAERAVLVTRYARKRANRRKPAAVQRAEALAHVLRHRSAAIHDDELLVGSFSSYRVGGSIFPELHGISQCEDLLAFRSRDTNPMQIRGRDLRALGLRVMPFWATRFLARRAFPPGKAVRFVVDQLRGDRFVINEAGGVAHLVPDYGRLLREGTEGLAADARARASAATDGEKRTFYEAVAVACEGLDALAAPYERLARDMAARAPTPARRADLDEIAEVCRRVPRKPARTMREALQSLLFAQIALNLESLDNAICPGRLDQLLLPYFRDDVAAGRLDEAGARELIGCFTVKMSEIVPVFSRRLTRIHGGMFNGQTVVVGGTDADGADATNELTWLFLDAIDQLRMRQPNYHVRIHAGTPPALLTRVAGMLRDGSGAPALMNDEVVVPMLQRRGASLADARDYSPVGCVEPVACGATFGSTDAALVNLALALERALGTCKGGRPDEPLARCRSADDLFARVARQVDHLVDELMGDLQAIERANAVHHPTPLTSALLRGCLESGVDASSGGATYNGSGVQGVGVADLADSLAAVEDVVFGRRLCDLPTLADALRADFAGHEALRGHLLKAPKFGNDDPAADRWARKVVALWSSSLDRHRNTRGGRYWAGFYSVTAHRAFGETTGALPSGRRAGQALANGLSPSTGLDRRGPTAALNSVAALDLGTHARNGINVNLTLDRGAMDRDTAARALGGLVRGHFAGGGMQFQMNVIDPATLRRAMDDPEAHPWLLVRVSGYSAYYADLSPAMKREILERTLHAG